MRNTACLIITEYDFNTKSLKLWARQKPEQVYESKRLRGFRLFFAEAGVVQIGSFSNQTESDMIDQLSLTRSFFSPTFQSKPKTI